MKTVLRIFGIIIPVVTGILLSTGCTSEGFSLGGQYLDSNIHTSYVDTCSIKMTTMYIDSVATSGNSIGLVGKIRDPYWGTIEATTYLAFSAPGKHEYDYEVEYDSAVLMMKFSGTYFGDTTKQQTIVVHPLTEVFELPTYGSFYSNDSVAYSPMILGSRTFTPRPFTRYNATSMVPGPDETNQFNILLNPVFGKLLLDKILSNDDVVSDDLDFQEYFPGFAVTVEGGENGIYGYTLETGDSDDMFFSIKLYFHYSTWQKVEESIVVEAHPTLNFYGIKYDRNEGSAFSNLTSDNREIATAQTQNLGLVQSLTASYVKVEFPYLNNLLELGDYGTILDATLLLYPAKGSFTNTAMLPKSLSMYVSDENDVSVGTISTYSGDALQTGNLEIDDMYNEDTYYSYDITSYLNDQLGAIGINKRNLQLICPQDSLSKTMISLTLGDQKFEHDKTRVIIKYLIYENE